MRTQAVGKVHLQLSEKTVMFVLGLKGKTFGFRLSLGLELET